MNGINKKLLAAALTVSTVALGSLFMNTQKAFAATVYPYYPNDLISESLFENSSSMSASAIQTFLNNENSGIKGLSFTEGCSPTVPIQPYRFTYYPNCGKKESAATIIYDAGKAYGINPQAIMATMQKEESLITTPYSTSGTYQASLNCAMGYTDGYASCAQSPFQGFFSQVDNGTWQLRTDIELMNGRNWWGYTPSSYPCANADTTTHLYNGGLYPGHTVTFANPGGTAKTITIADSATAALYCYTPYVGPKYTTGPYQGTGYSGSFNFVESFEQWWGSTVYAYAGEVTATTYDDSARTQQDPLSSPFPSGRTIYVTVSALNTGSKTWYPSFTHIATESPNNRSSAFQDSSWWQYNRPAILQQSSVAPGQTGTFQFSITMPNTDGEYHEVFGLVADGQDQGWMRDSASFGFDLTVSNPYNANASTWSMRLFTDPELHRQIYGINIGLYHNQKVYVVVNAKNMGSQAWAQSFTHIATTNPTNRSSPFADNSWISPDRAAAPLEPSVASGGSAIFVFSMTAPSTSGTYNESFGMVADGQASGWMPYPWMYRTFSVSTQPSNVLQPGQRLNLGDSRSSADGRYHLVMQYDGNLALYSQNRPLWASGTNNKGAAFAVMQGDGNLVVYSRSGKALWDSRTMKRPYSTLDVQTDGNLVIYASNGHAVWASGTSGKW